ncbi:unnamed protein product [Euphydryas editha]|uniref:Uncharacterized protein n=1 Tax=Euphydryas editha TaxID=104508 RepID=A0AAU9TI75_EUPED|nr:unnamed protein product [Euphydryas editha]
MGLGTYATRAQMPKLLIFVEPIPATRSGGAWVWSGVQDCLRGDLEYYSPMSPHMVGGRRAQESARPFLRSHEYHHHCTSSLHVTHINFSECGGELRANSPLPLHSLAGPGEVYQLRRLGHALGTPETSTIHFLGHAFCRVGHISEVIGSLEPKTSPPQNKHPLAYQLLCVTGVYIIKPVLK